MAVSSVSISIVILIYRCPMFHIVSFALFVKVTCSLVIFSKLAKERERNIKQPKVEREHCNKSYALSLLQTIGFILTETWVQSCCTGEQGNISFTSSVLQSLFCYHVAVYYFVVCVGSSILVCRGRNN